MVHGNYNERNKIRHVSKFSCMFSLIILTKLNVFVLLFDALLKQGTMIFHLTMKKYPFHLFLQPCLVPGGGGHSIFFSGRGVRPGFPKCGACELTFASEKGGL